LEAFFVQPKWDDRALLNILETYNSSPEMFMIRLINIIPKYFGLSGMFFMRFDHKKNEKTTFLKKQLHLSRTRNPKNITLLEKHCREWLDTSVFNDLGTEVKAHCHRFVTRKGNQKFMVMALSRPMKRNKNTALSVLVGFEETSAFGKKVTFSDDASIPETILMVEETEKEREEEFRNIKSAMSALMESQKQGAVGKLTEPAD
jgi:hypothetical protein